MIVECSVYTIVRRNRKIRSCDLQADLHTSFSDWPETLTKSVKTISTENVVALINDEPLGCDRPPLPQMALSHLRIGKTLKYNQYNECFYTSKNVCGSSFIRQCNIR